jgi:hypothetical protein
MRKVRVMTVFLIIAFLIVLCTVLDQVFGWFGWF